MPYPLYFEPDPQIPDADLLGYGDLVYNDGSRTYLSNDPERAAQFEVKPIQSQAPAAQTPVPDLMQQGQGPPPPQPFPGANGQMYMADVKDPQNPIKPYEGVQDPQTGELFDPGMPGTNPIQALGGLADVVRGTVGSGPLASAGPEENRAALGMGSGAPAQQAQQGPPAPQPIPGANGQLFKTDINDPQNPLKPLSPQELQIYQREGALPPDVAARQQGEMATMNQQTLDVNQQAMGEQNRIMSEATLKAMGENEAAKHKAEEDIRDQQAKMDRLEKERKQVNDMALDRSLIGAAGVGGALLAVIGSAMLGGVGSDAGLRMIDKMIDRHVGEQVAQKNTQLGMLADQIGNTQQAIAIGKAQLYKAVGDHAELLVQKTKNDVYEAQAPAILQNIRQKQLEYTQDWERKSLGNVIERAPAPPKPPSPEALQKYGELRRDRDAASDVVQRMEQQIGLIWQPGKGGQPGRYVNKDEKIKAGIEGVGAVEQWVPDFVYSTLGQKDGYQVRGAKQALAYAAIRQMQPNGIISDMDRKVGELASTMNTEEGLVHTLERLRNGEQQQKTNDAAQYGPDVVQTYDQRYRASGGQQQGTPAASRPATYKDVPRGTPQAANAVTPDDPEERRGMLAESVTALAQDKGIPPEGISILMAQAGHETNDFQNMPQNNAFGMKSSVRNRAAGAGSANLETTEGAGSGARRVRQEFATFDTPAAAAADMLSLLERNYPRALEALQAGDPDAYVAALKDGGYFTGDETGYLKGILRRL